MGRSKEIKVKIPVEQHLQLHTLKLTRGITIAEAVETALRNYLDGELRAMVEMEHRPRRPGEL